MNDDTRTAIVAIAVATIIKFDFTSRSYYSGVVMTARGYTVKDTEIMTPEKRAVIMPRFRADLAPKRAQSLTPPAGIAPSAASSPASAVPARHYDALPLQHEDLKGLPGEVIAELSRETKAIYHSAPVATPRPPNPVFILPPKRPQPNPDRATPDRVAELAAQEAFITARGATVLLPSNDPAMMDLPQMTFDHHTKKWTRRADAMTRTQWTRSNKQTAE